MRPSPWPQEAQNLRGGTETQMPGVKGTKSEWGARRTTSTVWVKCGFAGLQLGAVKATRPGREAPRGFLPWGPRDSGEQVPVQAPLCRGASAPPDAWRAGECPHLAFSKLFSGFWNNNCSCKNNSIHNNNKPHFPQSELFLLHMSYNVFHHFIQVSAQISIHQRKSFLNTLYHRAASPSLSLALFLLSLCPK